MNDAASMLNAKRDDDFLKLVLRHLEGQLDAGEAAVMRRRLAESEDCRRTFVITCYESRVLAEVHLSEAVMNRPIPITPKSGSRLLRPSMRYLIALAAAIVIAAGVSMIFLLRTTEHGAVPHPTVTTAMLTDAQGAHFAASGAAPPLGSSLTSEPLRLTAGKAQVMFNSTAVVDLSGPCEFSAAGPNRGLLTAGSIHAYVPPKAVGFSVQTPDGVQLRDLGTEFDLTTVSGVGAMALITRGRVECRDAAGDQRVATVNRLLITDAHGRWVHDMTLAPALDVLALDWFDAAGSHAAPLTIGPALRHVHDGVFAGDAAATDATDNWIIEAWARPEKAAGTGLIAYNGDPARSGFGILQSGGSWAGLFGGVTILHADRAIVPGRWVHLALMRRNGVTRLFIDGQLAGQTAAAPRPASALMVIGGIDKLAQNFAGQIRLVRIALLNADYNLKDSLTDRAEVFGAIDAKTAPQAHSKEIQP